MATKTSYRRVDKARVDEKLREFGAANKCPVSGHSDWTIIDDFVSVVPWNRNFVFDNTYPAVMLGCNGCGYMALFSATVLGLVDPYDEETE